MPDKTVEVAKVAFPKAFEAAIERGPMNIAMEDHQVLVRARYSLISAGTELAVYEGTHNGLGDPASPVKYPYYPGYTTVGEVIAAGPAVRTVKVGDTVLVEGKHFSHVIASCSDPRKLVKKIPDHISIYQALLSFMVTISSVGLLRAAIQPGDDVVVLGMGVVGNFAAQLCELHGGRTIAVDRVENRLRIAAKCGVSHTVMSGDSLFEGVLAITGQGGPKVVVEATGIPQVANTALKLVRDLGRVVLLGSTRGMVEIDMYHDIHRKGICVSGAHASMIGTDGVPDRSRLCDYAFRIMARNALIAGPLITHELPYEQAAEAYEMLSKRKDMAVGVVLRW